MIMNERFEKARANVIYAIKEYAGLGTYGEKSIHAVLKKYIEPNTDFHEVGVFGSIADICIGNEIYEIQTRALYKLKSKLKKFLPYYKVCVVHPIIADKTVYTFDPHTGTVLKKRKSPKKGYVYDFLPHVYGLKELISEPGISFKIMMINASEYRIPAVKKGRKDIKFDTVPDELVCEINIEKPSDFRKLLPVSLPDKFSSADYASAAHMTRNDASISLGILYKCGIIEKIDKKGNAFIYRIIE